MPLASHTTRRSACHCVKQRRMMSCAWSRSAAKISCERSKQSTDTASMGSLTSRPPSGVTDVSGIPARFRAGCLRWPRSLRLLGRPMRMTFLDRRAVA